MSFATRPVSVNKNTDGPGEMVTRAFTDSQPKGAPLPWRRIVSAKWTRKSFPRTAVADLEMFDGQKATAKVSEIDWKLPGPIVEIDARNGRLVRDVEHVTSYSIRWLKMDGGACLIRDGAWVRVERAELTGETSDAAPVPSIPDDDAAIAAVHVEREAFYAAAAAIGDACGLVAYEENLQTDPELPTSGPRQPRRKNEHTATPTPTFTFQPATTTRAPTATPHLETNDKRLAVFDLFSGTRGFKYGLEATGGFRTDAFC
jgi:hypothetical protein